MPRTKFGRFLLPLRGWIVLLLCLLVSSACGSGTPVAGTSVTPTVGPSGTVSAHITSDSALASQGFTQMAGDDTAVWVHDATDGIVSRIDPSTNAVVATIPVDQGVVDKEFGGIAIGEGAVWVADGEGGRLTRIDPQSNRVVATIPLASGSVSVAAGPGAVWVNNINRKTVTQVDPQTNRVVATIPIGDVATGISYGAGSLWICTSGGGAQGLTRIDPQTRQVQAQIDVGADQSLGCGDVVALDQTVWIAASGDGGNTYNTVESVDPATNKVTARIRLAANIDYPGGFAADQHGVWAVDGSQGLFRIDPRTEKVVGLLSQTAVGGVAVGAGAVWLADSQTGEVERITPSR
jgi:YVTN family beta-propeller protein